MTDWLDWPFMQGAGSGYGAWQTQLQSWCDANAEEALPHNLETECRKIVRSLGAAGLLTACVATGTTTPDVRALAVARATLAYHSGLADFAFAMQGLGSGAISLFGSPEQKEAWLPKVASGAAIAAFAMTEPGCGSDAANMTTAAVHRDGGWRINGEKTYISNGTIADVLTVFARTANAPGARGISAFIVRGDDPGLRVAERIDVIAPHPLARLSFDGVAGELIGTAGEGFRIGMETLNLFRVTVAAAALGFARRALDEAIGFARHRRLGSGTLADNAVTQATLANMALKIDASALLIARAAWQQDIGSGDNRRAAAMAKLHATESAQQVVDAAVQLHGGAGVTRGVKVEELYRDVRALRIYEGASEVQRQIIARDLLKRAQ